MDHHDMALAEDPLATAEPAGNARACYDTTDYAATRLLTLGLVHEMNNVLGGAAVLSEIYQGGSHADEGLDEGLALIHKSIGRLQTMVEHLKLLNGPVPGEPAYLNLSETVRAAFEMFAPLLPKTWTVVMAFPVEVLVVHLDESLLRRVLLNLTLNLRDGLSGQHGPAKKLHVGIRYRPGATAELTLSAGGGGTLSAGARARLDDARQRLHEMGGTLIAHANHEFVLEFPLVV